MPRWTPEARKRQSELIQSWKPWRFSTGPKTEEGKQRSSENGSLAAESLFGLDWNSYFKSIDTLQPIVETF